MEALSHSSLGTLILLCITASSQEKRCILKLTLYNGIRLICLRKLPDESAANPEQMAR